MVFGGILLIAFGLFCVFNPETAWHLKHFGKRWMYKNAAPSEAGILLMRALGGFTIFIGILFMFRLVN